MSKQPFQIGDPAPDFVCAASNNPIFHFNVAAGRYLVLSFYGSTAIEKNGHAIAFMTGEAMRHYFDDEKISFFGVSIDPADRDQRRVREMIPGIRYFWDFDYKISRLYGAIGADGINAEGIITYQSYTLVLDPNLRVLACFSLAGLEQHNRSLLQFLSQLPDVNAHAGVRQHAPVLTVPRVFEPSFCRQLIALYEAHGGVESGSMIERNGQTIGKIDHSFKRRKDYFIEDVAVRTAMRQRLRQRLLPEIEKAFQFKVTHIERYVVACYDSVNQGFFRPHRDNTTKGTAHRQFACTINLNAEEFDGGELRFPEFGTCTYRAPTGGAVIFSCSLLHEATPVTKGKRFATLPFLYDNASEKIRAENLHYLTGEVINMEAEKIA